MVYTLLTCTLTPGCRMHGRGSRGALGARMEGVGREAHVVPRLLPSVLTVLYSQKYPELTHEEAALEGATAVVVVCSFHLTCWGCTEVVARPRTPEAQRKQQKTRPQEQLRPWAPGLAPLPWEPVVGQQRARPPPAPATRQPQPSVRPPPAAAAVSQFLGSICCRARSCPRCCGTRARGKGGIVIA